MFQCRRETNFLSIVNEEGTTEIYDNRIVRMQVRRASDVLKRETIFSCLFPSAILSDTVFYFCFLGAYLQAEINALKDYHRNFF